jgi:tetratricopeptide (TPR) repeat protein
VFEWRGIWMALLQKRIREFFESKIFHYFILIVLPLAVFVQVLTFQFVSWDDESHILHNLFLQKLSLANVCVILTPGGIPDEQLYIPFTYLSYLVELSTLGLKSSGVHFDNLLLHLVNIILVYSFSMLLLRNRSGSMICALFFAVHPLQVETVAWAMGRKDLLMTMFSLLSLLNFTRFIKTNSSKSWILSLICFFAAVFSKPAAFVVPLLLPVLGWYFDRKIDRNLILRMLPFLAISAIACLINSKLEINSFGHEWKYVLFRASFIPAIAEDWCLRIFLLSKPTAYYSWYDYYMGNCNIVPGLAVITALLVFASYAFLRKIKILFTGLSFLIILFIPATILISWSFRDFVTADRYGYFPLVGAFLLAGALYRISERKTFKIVFASAFSFFIVVAAYKSYEQASIWRNSETLWKSVLNVHDDSFMAHSNLGNYYLKNKNDLLLAESHYRRANSITPDSDAWFNLGIICELTGRKDEAESCYRRALALNPLSAYALKRLALSYFVKKDFDNSLKYFLRLIEVSPNVADNYYFCGKIFEIKGDKEMAAKSFGYFEKLKKKGD